MTFLLSSKVIIAVSDLEDWLELDLLVVPPHNQPNNPPNPNPALFLFTLSRVIRS
jgi:hypothetical protein